MQMSVSNYDLLQAKVDAELARYMGLHDMFFDQAPNVLIYMDGYTGTAE